MTDGVGVSEKPVLAPKTAYAGGATMICHREIGSGGGGWGVNM